MNLNEARIHEKQGEALELLNESDVEYILFGGGAEGGKAQSINSKIFTPNGYKLMGDIKPGDIVLGKNSPVRVIATHPQGVKKVYRIEFSDGAISEFTE